MGGSVGCDIGCVDGGWGGAAGPCLLVVQSLIKANKDFDLLMIPNRPHAYGPDANYVVRRRWDFFVRNLADAVPGHEYQMKPSPPLPEPGAGPEEDDPDDIVW